MSTITLYLIPGAGTDWRLFSPQFECFPAAIVPQWLPPQHRRESLAHYAKRMTERIDSSRPFVLGGVSLGGMVAQEMAATVTPLAIILIASCQDSHALPLGCRMMGKCTRALPDVVVKLSFRFAAACLDHFKRNLPHRRQYARMLRTVSPRLIRWQSGAAAEWRPRERPTVPVFHLHGTRDPVIPLKNVRPQQVIEKGGHLINITHAALVNAFIAECLEKAERLREIDAHAFQPTRVAH